MTNYVIAASGYDPAAQVSCQSDPTVYENLVWSSTPIAQALLDAYVSSNPTYADPQAPQNDPISFSGDATGSGTGAITVTLANTGVIAGTYNNVTVNAKGLATFGANASYITGNQSITVSGDASGSGTTAIALTLANTAVTAGTYNNSATQVRPFTVDGKGRITNIGTAVTITPTWTNVSGKPTTIAGYGLSTDAYTKTQVNALTWAWGTAITGKPTTLSGYGITDGVNTSVLGAASGVATLDGTGKLTNAQIPAALVGAMVYQGVWNASTNSPTLVTSTGTKGNYYKVSVAGTTSIDGIASWNIGDLIIFDGSTWDKVEGGSSEVTSVFGRVGAVTLLSSDVTTALGFTPYDATNPTGYQTSGQVSSAISAAAYSLPTATTTTLGGVKVDGSTVTITSGTISATAPAFSAVTGKPTTLSGYGITDAAISTHNHTVDTLSNVTITSKATDDLLQWNGTAWVNKTIAGAGLQPAGSYLTGITSGQVTTALGYTPYNATNPNGYISGITNGQVITAIGYTPYNATNPAGYVIGAEYANLASFPVTGISTTLYIAVNTRKVYEWTGSAYVELSPWQSNADQLPEGSTNLYFTPARAQAAVTTITGNAGTATKLATSRNISMSGDVTWTVSFDGSANATAAGTLADSGVTIGTYHKVTVDSKGRVTNGASIVQADVTGVLGAGSITNTMLANAAVANLSGTNTGDETLATIKTKLGITTLSGSNTGDQTTITGNAGSATVLQTARNINGVSFDGSANITINAVDSTARVASSLLGVANGVATLDSGGKVLSTQLPSYVDDVVEGANLAALPATGETGKIYVALDTNKTYRWSGSAYVQITSGAVDSVAGKTGVVTLVKADVGLGSVDNTADVSKPVSTAQAAADTAIGSAAAGDATTKANAAQAAAIAASTPIAHVGAGGTSHANVVAAGAAGFMTGADKTKLDAITGTNTGDETLATIKTKLGITTLSGSNTGDQTIGLTGDVTGSGTGSFAATLANTTVTANSYGNATNVPSFTVDGKGRLTAAANVLITPAWASVTGKPTFATVATSGAYADLTGAPAAYTLPTASTTVLGGVKVDGTSVTITGGVISATGSSPTITLSGDATGSGTSSVAVTLSNSGVTAGTYSAITVDAKGRATSGVVPYLAPGAGAGLIKQITSGNIAAISGTSTIPYDNTTPLNTEGTVIWSKAFTTLVASSTVIIECSFTAETQNSNRDVIVALFRGSTCIGVAVKHTASGNMAYDFSMMFDDTPGAVGTYTYSCRVGLETGTSGSWNINQETTASFNGMLATSAYKITEWA